MRVLRSLQCQYCTLSFLSNTTIQYTHSMSTWWWCHTMYSFNCDVTTPCTHSIMTSPHAHSVVDISTLCAHSIVTSSHLVVISFWHYHSMYSVPCENTIPYAQALWYHRYMYSAPCSLWCHHSVCSAPCDVTIQCVHLHVTSPFHALFLWFHYSICSSPCDATILCTHLVNIPILCAHLLMTSAFYVMSPIITIFGSLWRNHSMRSCHCNVTKSRHSVFSDVTTLCTFSCLWRKHMSVTVSTKSIRFAHKAQLPSEGSYG